MHLPNVAIQSFSLFKKSQNKEKLAATGSPNYRRQALGVFARLTFFYTKKPIHCSESAFLYKVTKLIPILKYSAGPSELSIPKG